MRLLFTAILFVIVFMVSCTKEKVPCTNCPTEPIQECYTIDEIKQFFVFNVGSYWVYKEENSGFLDTLTVTQSQNNTGGYNFWIEMYSTNQDFYYYYWPGLATGNQSCNNLNQICSRCIYIKRVKSKPGNFVHEQTCLFFNNSLLESTAVINSSFPDNKIIIDGITDSIELNSMHFSKTISVRELNTYMEGNQPTIHQFSKGVGLIKKELLDSLQTWELVDYYIQP